MSLTIIISCLFAFLFSFALTRFVYFHAQHLSLMDIPNQRSCHQIPTPRGGGIAIVTTFLLIVLGLLYTHKIDTNFAYALLGGGILIAGVGLWDDIVSIPVSIRFLTHTLSAIWVIYWLGGFTALDLGIIKIPLHAFGYLLALFGIVWCINFYNFMDGIDGLASSEGIFVSTASSIALWMTGALQLSFLSILFAMTIIGFILWNWPPAKIFLGDVGSGFIGFIFATFGLYSINQSLLPFSFWFILLSVFICDATFTLLLRIGQGKKWYSAHREHAYQHLTSFGANHKQVVSGIMFFNCTILFPMAMAILYFPVYSTWLMMGASISLFLFWVKIKSIPINL